LEKVLKTASDDSTNQISMKMREFRAHFGKFVNKVLALLKHCPSPWEPVPTNGACVACRSYKI
jgi:hypothetical protein